jgi:hypothetical protein
MGVLFNFINLVCDKTMFLFRNPAEILKVLEPTIKISECTKQLKCSINFSPEFTIWYVIFGILIDKLGFPQENIWK